LRTPSTDERVGADARVRAGTVKRIVVCCDGTWNRPDAPSPTNVAKLWRAVAERDEQGVDQPVLYHPGVGTGRFDRIRGGGFGWGLSRNVRDCYRFVVDEFEPGDELFLFGFSRGAYTARSTVGLIRNAGILRREHVDRIDEAYRLYRGRGDDRHPNGAESTRFRARYSHDEIAIRFVGVWDTVGALGIPGVPKVLCGRLWAFHDTQLSGKVELAYQALAIDEQRRPFVPSLWYRSPDDDRVLEQRWFAGVHSDVGGGYPDCSLAEIALWWMAGRARAAGLALKPDHLVNTADPDREERRLGKQISPSIGGALHDSFKPLYWPLGRLHRRLVDADKPKEAKDGIEAASTATARADYGPGNLTKYLSDGGEVAEVALPTTNGG
jgi:uncharacterized protein (DUF2235 family)